MPILFDVFGTQEVLQLRRFHRRRDRGLDFLAKGICPMYPVNRLFAGEVEKLVDM